MRLMRLLSMVLLAGALVPAMVAPAPAQTSRRKPASPERQKMPATAVPGGDVAHGQYLVERVIFCVECHSPRDGEGNIIAAEAYMGGPIPFRPPWPNDWALRAPRNRGLPGFERVAVRPQRGDLPGLELVCHTPRGPIGFRAEKQEGGHQVAITLPPDMAGELVLPAAQAEGGAVVGSDRALGLSRFALPAGKTTELVVSAEAPR